MLAVDLMPVVNQIMNIAIAVLGLGLVIFLHELGHFAVAKWCNVYVERFSIGFGTVLFSRKWGETEYALSLIPFGGYVKMLGQDDADPSQLTNEEIAADPRSYIAKPVYQRMAIISAGVTMNVLTAFIFFIIVYMAGFPTSPSVIGDARPGKPAWEAGIAAGDEIEKINGERISTFTELQMSVALSSGPLRMQGKHADGAVFDLTVEPSVVGPLPQIGVGPMESLTVFDARPRFTSGKPEDTMPTFQKGDQIIKVGDNEVKNAIEFHREVAANTANPLAITVKRTLDANGAKLSEPTTETINLKDNFFRTLGLTLDSGPIVAVRQGSPAEKAGLKKGDKLAILAGLNIGTEIDPLKLAVEFAHRAGTETDVTVIRQPPGGGQESVPVKLVPDDVPGWLDQPDLPGEPLAIPSIGVAFHILPVVLAVAPDGPADKAGIKPGRLKKMMLTKRSDLPSNQDPEKDTTITIKFDDANSNNVAHAFWLMQCLPQRKVTLSVTEDAKQLDVDVVPQPDPNWLLPIVGVRLDIEKLIQKADNIGEACTMSLRYTKTQALNIYLTLRSLFITRRVSYKELRGPLGIAETAYRIAKEGWIHMLLFLGFLSVNLAVLNFLPIPVLDGGHMVFLIWEAVTRRKPNEKVLIGATYVGFAFVMGLMALLLYLDIFVHRFGRK